MECQNLLCGSNKKPISKCRFLIFLPRVLSVKMHTNILVLIVGCDFTFKPYQYALSKIVLL